MTVVVLRSLVAFAVVLNCGYLIALLCVCSISWGVRLSKERPAILHFVHSWSVFVHGPIGCTDTPVPWADGHTRSTGK